MPVNDKEILIQIRTDFNQAIKGLDETGRKVDGLSQSSKTGAGNVKQFNQQTRIGAQTVRLFGLALGTASLVAFSKGLVDITDSAKRMEGQLKLVTESQAELNEVQQALFEIAQKTRSELEGTVTLYARVARNSKELNLTQKQLLDLTTITNQAIQVGGARSSEAAAGVVQFSQALASGVLRGDEFNSVSENMPRLAQAIADGMGISIGALRQLAGEGKLTSDVITRALFTQTQAVDDEFGKLPRTVGQALTQMNNEVIFKLRDTDLTPLTESIDELRKTLTNPATIAGIQTIAAAIFTAARKTVEWTSALTRLSVVSIEFFAKKIGGFDENLIKLEKDLNKTLKEISLVEQNRRFIGYDKADQRLQELEKRRDELKAAVDAEKKRLDSLSAFPSIDKPKKTGTDDGEEKTPEIKKPESSVGESAASKEYIANQEKLLSTINQTTQALRLEAETLGLSAEQALIRKLEIMGASEEELKEIQHLTDKITLHREEMAAQQEKAKVEQETLEALEEARKSDKKLVEELRTKVAVLSLSEEQQKAANEAMLNAEAISKLSAEGVKRYGTEVVALSGKLRALEEKQEETAGVMDEFAKGAARSIQSSLAQFLFDPFDEGLDGMLKGFADTMRQIAAEAAARQILLSLAGGVPGLGFMTAGTQHTGGMVGSASPQRSVSPALFSGAGRYHSGGFPGLRSDEVPIIAQQGEEVLSRTDPRNQLNGGGGMRVVNNFSIEAPGGSVSRESQQQVASAAGRGINRALRRNS